MGTGQRSSEVEGEIGRIQVKNGAGIMPEHQPKERIWSLSIQELAMMAGTELSYANGRKLLNRLLRREGRNSIRARTYQDFCCRRGQELGAYMVGEAEKVLEQAGFDGKTGQLREETTLPLELGKQGASLSGKTNIQQAIQIINASRENAEERINACAVALENPDDTCYVSVDEIGVKHQKEHRRGTAEKQGVYVWNTVATIQSKQFSYTLTDGSMAQTFRSTLACLLSHELLAGRNLVFFTDGASDIRRNIEGLFTFHPYTIILDWYHLKKRCQEYLSMSMKGGKEKRNAVLQKVLRILWVGNVAQAVHYLSSLGTDQLRPINRINDLCAYLEKHRSHIPCYALRHQLGLRNSSNMVEKANDLLVAQRQKHNGMSWSVPGSSALAHLKALFLNREVQPWLHSRSLPGFLHPAA